MWGFMLQASLGNFGAALQDARKCVMVKPDWARGYSRLGAAYFGLGRLSDAKTAYREGGPVASPRATWRGPMGSGLARIVPQDMVRLVRGIPAFTLL